MLRMSEVKALEQIYESLTNGEKLLVFGQSQLRTPRLHPFVTILAISSFGLIVAPVLFVYILWPLYIAIHMPDVLLGISFLAVPIAIVIFYLQKDARPSTNFRGRRFYALTSSRLLAINRDGNVETVRERNKVNQVSLSKDLVSLQFQEEHRVLDSGAVVPGRLIEITVQQLAELPAVIGGHGFPKVEQQQ